MSYCKILRAISSVLQNNKHISSSSFVKVYLPGEFKKQSFDHSNLGEYWGNLWNMIILLKNTPLDQKCLFEMKWLQTTLYHR